MTNLFIGSVYPVTNTIGFLRCNALQASQEFCDWQKVIQDKRGVHLVKSEIHGGLASGVKKLFPLTSVERRRYLFIPTNSEWTAFLDNGHKGTDAFSAMSYLAKRLSCEAVRATYTPDDGKHYPARILEIYGPDSSYFLNYIRSISAAFDGKKWSFATGGEALPFEEVDRYLRKSIKDRFTPEMLDIYLRALGICAFDEKFYSRDEQRSIFIEKVGAIAPSAQEFELDYYD